MRGLARLSILTLVACRVSAPPRWTDPPPQPKFEFMLRAHQDSPGQLRDILGRLDGKVVWTLTYDRVDDAFVCPDEVAFCGEVIRNDRKQLVRIDRSGKEMWSVDTSDAERSVFKVEHGALKRMQCKDGAVRSYALETGAVVGDFHVPIDQPVLQCALPPDGEAILTNRGGFALFDAAGKPRAQWDVGALSDAPQLFVLGDDLFAVSNGPTLRLFEVKAVKAHDAVYMGETPVQIAPVRESEDLFAFGRRGTVRRLGRDGAAKWTRRLPMRGSSGAVSEDGTVIASGEGGRVFALAPDGRALWGSVTSDELPLRPTQFHDLGASVPAWAVPLRPDFGSASRDESFEVARLPFHFIWTILPTAPGDAWVMGEKSDGDAKLFHFREAKWEERKLDWGGTFEGRPITLHIGMLVRGESGLPWILGYEGLRGPTPPKHGDGWEAQSSGEFDHTGLWALSKDGRRTEIPAPGVKSFSLATNTDPLALCDDEGCVERDKGDWILKNFDGHAASEGQQFWAVARLGAELWFSSGDLFRETDGHFEKVPGAPAHIHAMWGSSPTDVWAESRGRLYHRTGERWDWEPAPLEDIRKLWGSGPTDVWACGYGGLAHYDGQLWRTVGDLELGCKILTGGGPNDVWVASGDEGKSVAEFAAFHITKKPN